jgi:hypothetical protein
MFYEIKIDLPILIDSVVIGVDLIGWITIRSSAAVIGRELKLLDVITALKPDQAI